MPSGCWRRSTVYSTSSSPQRRAQEGGPRMPVSPNVKGFHGLMQLRDRFGEISEEACLTLYFNFFQFWLWAPLFPHSGAPPNSSKASQAPHFGESSWEEKIKDHGRVLSNGMILGCDVWHKINGTSLCGNGVARRGWEAGRAWSTGNHTQRYVVKDWEKDMCVVSHTTTGFFPGNDLWL